MSIRSILFLLFVIISGLLAYKFAQVESVPTGKSHTRETTVQSSINLHDYPAKDLFETNFFEGNTLPESKLALSKYLEEVLGDISSKNDWVVTLTKKDEEYLRINAPSLGIELNGGLPELGIARLKVIDTLKNPEFILDLLRDNSMEPNFSLRQPLPPRAASILEESFSKGNFIQWLGGANNRSSFGTGIKLALLDSGVDISHPLLSKLAVREQDFLKKSLPTSNSHGTAMASVIGGRGNEYIGVAPGCEILSYRVIDESGKTDSFTVASAIVRSVKDGARVINLSLGGHKGSAVLRNSISYARDHGVFIVAAVGNEGTGLVNYPAVYPGVTGVTSVGRSGRVSSFSNFGDGVDLAAPGVGILTAWQDQGNVSFSGTSVSSAIVSGVIAAELSKNPSLTFSQMNDLLKSTANESEKPGHDPISGFGVVSLARLENRGNPEYSDPALVGYHFGTVDHVGTGTMPFEVMVQNQGNTWLSNLKLEVSYLGRNKQFRMDNLAPGETRSEKLYLRGDELNEVVEIKSKLSLPLGLRDERIENNERSSVIKF